MLEYGFDQKTIDLIDFDAIGEALSLVADEIEDHDSGIAEYYADCLRRELLGAPVGGMMLNAADSLVCDFALGRGTAFLYGSTSMYMAIVEADEELADHLGEYASQRVDSRTDQSDPLTSGPEASAVLKVMSQSGRVLHESSNGLAVLSDHPCLDLALEQVEDMALVTADLREYLRIGAGWLTYQMLASIK